MILQNLKKKKKKKNEFYRNAKPGSVKPIKQGAFFPAKNKTFSVVIHKGWSVSHSTFTVIKNDPIPLQQPNT